MPSYWVYPWLLANAVRLNINRLLVITNGHFINEQILWTLSKCIALTVQNWLWKGIFIPSNTRSFIFTRYQNIKILFSAERGTYICAHAWILFKLCILITQHIQAIRIYLFNSIIKNRAQEATLTYSYFETIHVSKFLSPKPIVLSISNIWQLEWFQNTTGIISIPQNR